MSRSTSPHVVGRRLLRARHPRSIERIAQLTVTDEGKKTSAVRFRDPRVQALAGALPNLLFAAGAITNKSHERSAAVAGETGTSRWSYLPGVDAPTADA